MAMKRYNPKAVQLIVGGRVITGYAEGTFLNATKLEDNLVEHIGSQGEVAFSVNGNNAGEVTCTLMSMSPSIRYLNELANSTQIVDCYIVDSNENGGRYGGSEAVVRKSADREWSNEITTVEFTIFVADYKGV